jgi:hypothetical protein
VLISNGRFKLLLVFDECGVVAAVDIAAVSLAVALMAATGAVAGLGESAALGVVARVRDRVRAVFGGDARSVDALERAVRKPDDADRIRELAAALAWYGQRDEQFAGELAEWARRYAPAGSVTQNVRVGRDAYVAGRDMTIHRPRRPEGEE